MLKLNKHTKWLTSIEELQEDMARCLLGYVYDSYSVCHYQFSQIRERLKLFYNILCNHDVTEFHIVYSECYEFEYNSETNNIVPTYILQIDEMKNKFDSLSHGQFSQESMLFVDTWKTKIRDSNNIIVVATKDNDRILGALYIRPYLLPQPEYEMTTFFFTDKHVYLEELSYPIYKKLAGYAEN